MCKRVCYLPPSFPEVQWLTKHFQSDYKDDGTNILLDANENAYGPGLALTDDGKLINGNTSSIEIDLLGLNRYPDPYVRFALKSDSLTKNTIVTSTN